MYYKCHKINPIPVGSDIDFPVSINNKKATINPINKKGNRYFQYAVTVALNHEQIKKDLQIIKKNKTFIIDKYNWKEVNYLCEN